MKILTKQEQKLYEDAEICYICKEKLENKNWKDKKCRKVINDCHYTGEKRSAVHSIYNLKYGVPKKSPIVFRNESN